MSSTTQVLTDGVVNQGYTTAPSDHLEAPMPQHAEAPMPQHAAPPPSCEEIDNHQNEPDKSCFENDITIM